MAGRIRSIKPEILEDERSAALSSDAWRLWVSMWLLADDFGNLRGDSRRLAAEIFWGVERPPKVDDLLSQLYEARFIEPYVVRDQKYFHVRNWEKHQRIDNAGKARVPKPEEGEPAAIRGESPRDAAVRGSDLDLEEDLLYPDSPKAHRVKFDFLAVYALYPRKVGKTKGLAICERTVKTQKDYERLLVAVKRYAGEMRTVEKQYIKHFDRWMGCWQDYADDEAIAAPSPQAASTSNVDDYVSPTPGWMKAIIDGGASSPKGGIRG